jgi:hypothetical protein
MISQGNHFLQGTVPTCFPALQIIRQVGTAILIFSTRSVEEVTFSFYPPPLLAASLFRMKTAGIAVQ